MKTTRRSFLVASSLLPVTLLSSAVASADSSKGTPSNFTLWQLPHRSHSQSNSYVFRMGDGKIVVMDGGTAADAEYLRGFLGSLGDRVAVWFLSHPHSDHIGALNEILKKPDTLKIGSVYHSRFSPEFYGKVESGSQKLTEEFYSQLDKLDIPVVDVKEPGLVVRVDGTTFKMLDVKDETVTANAYNNSCLVIRVEDGARSAVFLGDAGIEQGNRLLAGPHRNDLDCDYLQLAHHGQRGVSKDFYRTVKFKACLWPAPLWLYDNNAGKGFDTHEWESVEIRNLMDQLGIKKRYLSHEGLCVVG